MIIDSEIRLRAKSFYVSDQSEVKSFKKRDYNSHVMTPVVTIIPMFDV